MGKKRDFSYHKKRVVPLLILLALVCVGGAELIACRLFAPALYRQITAPVRHGAGVVAEFGGHVTGEVSAWWSELTAPKEELPAVDLQAAQVAGDPAIVSHEPVADPALTELKERSGQEVLTGGSLVVVYYNQGDPAWADQPYGSNDIARYACGPVTMAMAVSSMTDQTTDPVQMAQWSVEHGYWAKDNGSYLSIVEGTAQAYGLKAVPLQERTPDAVREALLSGNLLVALMGPGHFTKGGHFILLRGVTLSGSLLVADPNSLDRSLTEWDPQLILDELSSSTNDGAPLWVLSPADI